MVGRAGPASRSPSRRRPAAPLVSLRRVSVRVAGRHRSDRRRPRAQGRRDRGARRRVRQRPEHARRSPRGPSAAHRRRDRHAANDEKVRLDPRARRRGRHRPHPRGPATPGPRRRHERRGERDRRALSPTRLQPRRLPRLAGCPSLRRDHHSRLRREVPAPGRRRPAAVRAATCRSCCSAASSPPTRASSSPTSRPAASTSAPSATSTRLLDARRAGAAILLISEDLDEIMSLADRIAVIYRGRISPPLPRAARHRARPRRAHGRTRFRQSGCREGGRCGLNRAPRRRLLVASSIRRRHCSSRSSSPRCSSSPAALRPSPFSILSPEGAAGSHFALLETLTRATPLIFTGLAAAVAFRAKLWNIGARGPALHRRRDDRGARHRSSAAARADPRPDPHARRRRWRAASCCSAPPLLKTRFGVDEVVTTLLLNFIVVLFVSYAARRADEGSDGPRLAAVVEGRRRRAARQARARASACTSAS